jgi:hypothetical protein
MRFSTAFLIDCFFILRANLLLISSNGVPLRGVVTLYIILDTQLYMRLQHVRHRQSQHEQLTPTVLCCTSRDPSLFCSYSDVHLVHRLEVD